MLDLPSCILDKARGGLFISSRERKEKEKKKGKECVLLLFSARGKGRVDRGDLIKEKGGGGGEAIQSTRPASPEKKKGMPWKKGGGLFEHHPVTMIARREGKGAMGWQIVLVGSAVRACPHSAGTSGTYPSQDPWWKGRKGGPHSRDYRKTLSPRRTRREKGREGITGFLPLLKHS